MMETVPVVKDENSQRPVPAVWRNALSQIVAAFEAGDFRLARGVAGVRPVSQEKAAEIAGNIHDYGERLTSLPQEAWQTSACQWMRGHWAVLVDLFTIEEGASDLVLDVRVHEEGSAYLFEIKSVYVP